MVRAMDDTAVSIIGEQKYFRYRANLNNFIVHNYYGY